MTSENTGTPAVAATPAPAKVYANGPGMPPTPKQLKKAEMMKHFDSHHHLADTYAEQYLRPIIVEAPVKGRTGEDACRVDTGMLSVVAALANSKTILITDMAVMNGVETEDVNITYLVHKSDMSLDVMETMKGKDTKVFYHVQSVDEALEHIKVRLQEVNSMASPKDPLALSGLLWSFMATREIRIVGSFRHMAAGLSKANLLQICYPSTEDKQIFMTKSVGRNAFSKNNFARVLQTYIDNPTLPVELEDKRSDPYFNLAYQNCHAVDDEARLDVKLIRYGKNRFNRFKKEALHDTPADLIIIGTSDWAELKIEHAAVVIVDPNSHRLFNPEDFGDQLLFACDNMHTAIDRVIALKRAKLVSAMTPNYSRLNDVKTIHVFTDVIEEAY